MTGPIERIGGVELGIVPTRVGREPIVTACQRPGQQVDECAGIRWEVIGREHAGGVGLGPWCRQIARRRTAHATLTGMRRRWVGSATTSTSSPRRLVVDAAVTRTRA